MKINNKAPNRNKTLFYGVAVLMLVCIAGYIYLAQLRDSSSPTVNYNPPTEEQSKAGEDVKEQAIERGSDRGQESTTAVDQAEIIKMTTSYDRTARQLTVSTQLHNSISWDKCLLVLTQGQVKKSFEARTVYQQDASFCGGFTIPTQGMSGDWRVTLNATSLDNKTHEETLNVAIN